MWGVAAKRTRSGDGSDVDFYSNLCLRRAIERNIEIIGEAMNRILKIDRKRNYNMRFCLNFKVEKHRFPKDYRRMILSYIKKSLSENRSHI